MSWKRFLLSVISSSKKLVGSDLLGNQYYERITSGGRIRRSVEMKRIPDEYQMKDIPPEWERWLRGISKRPPTNEEQEVLLRNKQIMSQKIKELKKKEESTEPEHQKVTMTTKATSHASSQSYKTKHETDEDPVSTGNMFQPGSWKPYNKQ